MDAKKVAYRVMELKTWAEFDDLAKGPEFRSWGFRGHADARWKLESTITRHLLGFGIHKDCWKKQEERIVRIFKRKAHLLLDHIPPDDDDFQWLALMQHHGAPTRLLDLTWSPYVAAFFALERSTAEQVAIWALNPARITHKKGQRIQGASPDAVADPHAMGPWYRGNFEKYFLPGNIAFVVTGEPLVMNRRLVAQLGTFVIPGMIDRSVEEILEGYENPEDALAKIVLPKAVRDEAMGQLYNMNITQFSLFPDLDGLARSMFYELEYHWAFNPKTMEDNPGYKDQYTLWSGTALNRDA